MNTEAAPRTRHPQAITTLIMGIVSVLLPILGPFVWYHGQRMLADIDRSPIHIDGRGAIAAGRTLGAIVTVLWLAPLLAVGLVLAFTSVMP